MLVGLGTRTTALLSSGSMAYAYFIEHQPHELPPIQNSGEAAVMFTWALLLIVFTGTGPWSLDRLLRPATRSSAPMPETRRQPTAV